MTSLRVGEYADLRTGRCFTVKQASSCAGCGSSVTATHNTKCAETGERAYPKPDTSGGSF